MSNSESYKHPKWQQTRLRVMERDRWKCVACGDAESTLHVHHLTYHGEPWEVPDEWLQTLCENCHAFLGPHPKAGVYWHQCGAKCVVAIMWCPMCAGLKFKDKGSYFKCMACGWDCGCYSERGITLGKKVEVVEDAKKTKPKEYSLGWLKGMISKVRKGGTTDQQIFAAMFPNAFDASLFVEPLHDAIVMLQQDLKSGTVSAEQELALVECLVMSRRRIEDILSGTFHACNEVAQLRLLEATDGTNS